MAVTMTAELADCFATKSQGVAFVVDAFRAAFPKLQHWFYAIDGRFRPSSVALARPLDLAATNWLAIASLVSRRIANSVLIDVGSTTTDVIPIMDGRVAAHGMTDLGRLQAGELVYTGILRTPACAIVRSVPIGRQECPIAAELFAIAADAYRWLGKIDDRAYTCETPDGRGTSQAECGVRLARLVCADRTQLDAVDLTSIAEHIVATQVDDITCAVRSVLTRWERPPKHAVLAGAGEFLAHNVASALGMASVSVRDYFGVEAARAAPATAVALLLADSCLR
jgi:probable H4MPT-linked C1 transfer pathway protein